MRLPILHESMRYVCFIIVVAFPMMYPEHAPVMVFGFVLGGWLVGSVGKQMDALTSRVDALRDAVAPGTPLPKPERVMPPMSRDEWFNLGWMLLCLGGLLAIGLIHLVR